METNLSNLLQKPGDYKICNRCGQINWHENEKCHSCGGKKFDNDKKAVQKYYEDEVDFYITFLNETEILPEGKDSFEEDDVSETRIDC